MLVFCVIDGILSWIKLRTYEMDLRDVNRVVEDKGKQIWGNKLKKKKKKTRLSALTVITT